VGARRGPGRRLDLGQPQVGHQPLAAAGGQAGQYFLQFRNVTGHRGDHVVRLAGHVVRGDDLRHGPDVVIEDAGRPWVVPGERGRHVYLQREPGLGGVELGPDDADDPGLLQPADPVQGCRRGKPDQAGQFHVRAVRVGLQRSEQLYVNFVKFNGHLTVDYEAKVPHWPNSVHARATMAT
jgi:hypothetical protein